MGGGRKGKEEKKASLHKREREGFDGWISRGGTSMTPLTIGLQERDVFVSLHNSFQKYFLEERIPPEERQIVSPLMVDPFIARTYVGAVGWRGLKRSLPGISSPTFTKARKFLFYFFPCDFPPYFQGIRALLQRPLSIPPERKCLACTQ